LHDILLSFFHEKSAWELLAVFLGLAYLALAMRESNWCWPLAFISTAIYTGLFWHVSLLMDSALNVYYMAMAIYGWWSWNNNSLNQKASRKISRWPFSLHLTAVGATVCLSIASGVWLQKNTQAAWPYLDSFTTWGSVLATVMVARKILENWIYWFVIDAVSLALYIERGLYPTALLFVIYLVMCVFGFIAWKRHYQRIVTGPLTQVEHIEAAS